MTLQGFAQLTVVAASSATKPPLRLTVVTPQVSIVCRALRWFGFPCRPLACLNGAFAKFTAAWAFALPMGACFFPTAIADGPATTKARPTAVERRRLVLFMCQVLPFRPTFSQ